MSESQPAQPTVVVTRAIPGELDLDGARVCPGSEALPERAAVLERIAGATVVVTMYTDRVDAAFLDAAGPGLRGICNFAVGVDNIDLDACRSRGVVVTNTPKAVTEGTADLAWLLVLAVARRLIEADRYARSEAYPANGQLGMAQLMGRDLTGRRLLIVGAGRIGYAVALRSLGWGMRVAYVARSQHRSFEHAPVAARRVELDEGLAQADVVSVHVPLTEQTHHLINAHRLGLMKREAILVNTARGPVVDEEALADALEGGRLWGAGLDVHEHEPRVNPRLAQLSKVVLTPHIGSGAIRYRLEMTAMVRANAQAILDGTEPPNRVV